MNFQKTCGLAVSFIALVGLNFVGCVRVDINTSGGVAPKAAPYADQSPIVHKISHLSRFGNIECEIEKDDVEKILNYASLVARCGDDNNDPLCAQEFTDMDNDFGCDIGFELNNLPSGPVGLQAWPPIFTFTSTPGLLSDGGNPLEEDPLDCLADGVICSQSDLEAVWGKAPPNDGIKIVRDILFCETTPFRTSWAGCAQFPGTGQAIAVTRDPGKNFKLEGILWLHEFGHTKGLRHIDKPLALNRDPDAVMAPNVNKSRTKLNRQECFRLRGGLQ